MPILEGIIEKVKKNPEKIVLPESGDERVVKAAVQLTQQEIVEVILIGEKSQVQNNFPDLDLAGIEMLTAREFEKIEEYSNALYEFRKSKGMTKDEARALLLENPLYFGCMLVKQGYADGMVAGAVYSSADVLRSALQTLKTAPGVSLVSAAFLMEVPDCKFGEKFGDDGVLVFADCALNATPNAEQMAHIAIASAKTFKDLVGKEPRVAMLSFSTKGSGKHAEVDKVREATEIAKKLAPDLIIDGEMQIDAAIVPSVGAKKVPNSKVAGTANVLVFPDLNSGNIGYKLVQRLAGARALGPLGQGIAMPVNDLSRGCSAADIVGTVALTAYQAYSQKKKK